MAYAHILVADEEPVIVITMNRPERRNALSAALMGELIEALHGCAGRQEVRAVILAGNGPAFSAGHDLNQMLGREADDYRSVFALSTELMTLVQSIPQPVIARVHGMATAAGCQLAASCDLVVASEDARFATPGVRIGLFCTTPMVALTRAIGRKRALEMLLTGTPIDARTAADWGLVNRVVPAAELERETRALALQIAEASPLVVAIGKQAFYAQIDLDQAKAYTYAKEVMSTNAMADDAQEGMGAFVAKRTPRWTGK
jgi:enoyl-CoA hydratase/carnithine racemase